MPHRIDVPYALLALLLRPVMRVWTRPRWEGGEHLPREGGYVLAANHVSAVDPVAVAHFSYVNGQPPRILAKDSLFRVPVLGAVMRATRQVPVARGSRDAASALTAAVRAVERGDVVLIFPEATHTKDPQRWPMRGKTGVARIALTTGCPVIPVGQWGLQDQASPGHPGVRALPRPRVRVAAGPAVDLEDLRGRPLETAVLEEATERIMEAITGLVAGVRGETAPAVRHDPRRPAAAEPTAAAEQEAVEAGLEQTTQEER